jgi:GT2 family glycosyltransferase
MTVAPASTYAVVIPNWNGAAFIERCLGSVQAALRAADLTGADIIVHDDASDDDSVARMQAAFPTVRVLASAQNIGFGASVNRAMQATSAEWVFLLNNDLALATDFCTRLLAARDALQGEAPPLFAIGALTRDWATQQVNHAGQRAVFRHGLLQQEGFESDALVPSDFFQAGACLIHRARFLELGGFAPMFHPGYWEDYDLAWAAQQRGWGVYYEPRAIAYHCGKGSMRQRYGAWGVSLMLRRNHLLFNWANLTSAQLRTHLAALPALVWRDTARPGEAGWARALLEALPRLPAALHLRHTRRLLLGGNAKE